MITDVTKMNKEELLAKAIKAFNYSKDVTPSGPACGCGRVYVSLGYKPIRKNSWVKGILERAGFKVMTKPYDSGLFIYVGYDNADGYALAMGEKIAEEFRKEGIRAGKIAEAD